MNLPPLTPRVTLEQQFRLRKYKDSLEGLSREEIEDLLIQVTRLLFVKENICEDLLKQIVAPDSSKAA